MSAFAFPVYNAACSDCAEGAGPFDYEDDAAAWVDNHNAEHHSEPDRSDEEYENYRDSRLGF